MSLINYWKIAAKLVGREYFEGNIERNSDWLEIQPKISKIADELPYMPRSNAVFIAVMCGFSHPQKGQDFLLRLLPTATMGDYLPLLDFEQRAVLSQLFSYFLEDRSTQAHEVFIDACNILSRNQGRAGEVNAWRESLGDDRKRIGDLACYLVLDLGLRAR